MHIAIADNMSLMGLSTKAISAVQKTTKKLSAHGSPYMITAQNATLLEENNA